MIIFIACWIFSDDVIARVKKDYKVKYDDIFYIIQNVVLLYGTIIFIFSYFGFFDMEYTNLLSFLCRVQFEFWIMSFGKDITIMKFLHPIMHTPEWYHTHETHHKVKREIQMICGYNFDILDILLENLIGTAFIISINYLIWGTHSINWCSFIWLGWSDSQLHSLNPYYKPYYSDLYPCQVYL